MTSNILSLCICNNRGYLMNIYILKLNRATLTMKISISVGNTMHVWINLETKVSLSMVVKCRNPNSYKSYIL